MDSLDTLYVTTPGSSLHLEGDALRVVHPDHPQRRLVPMLRLESMVLWGGVAVSPDALRRCAELRIHVTWISQNGRLIASVGGDEPGRGELRLAQYRAFNDTDHRVDLARLFVAGKLQGYRQLLLRAARDATEERKQGALREVGRQHGEAIKQLADATSLAEILGIEGRAARVYFANSSLIFSRSAPLGRSRRPPLEVESLIVV